ncbi:MAG: hypothetical protein ACHQU0_03835 [Candidatus Paceibacteria bacterium]
MSNRKYNPEKRTFRGRSYKKGAARVAFLAEKQAAEVASLEATLAQLEVDGDEYHAEGVLEDLLAATSLARLLHKV